MNKKKVLIWLGVIIVIVSIFVVKRKTSSAPIKVKAVRGSIIDAVYGIGTVTAAKTYEYKVGVTTQVSSLFVSEGMPVKKGQRLLTIESGGVITAPFAGTVTGLYYQEGENVSPSSTVISITDLKDRYVLVTLEQQGALKVKPGQQVQISFESLRDQKMTGKVTSIYSNEQKEFAVRIDTNQLMDSILPGMTADVAIVIQEKADALMVPVAAIKDFQVQKVNGRELNLVPVKVGLIDGEMAELINSNLKEGDELQLFSEN